jgi:hypothetical protein
LESLMQEEPDMDYRERIRLAFEITKLAFEWANLNCELRFSIDHPTMSVWKRY